MTAIFKVRSAAVLLSMCTRVWNSEQFLSTEVNDQQSFVVVAGGFSQSLQSRFKAM